jgi:hypothetical protein
MDKPNERKVREEPDNHYRTERDLDTVSNKLHRLSMPAEIAEITRGSWKKIKSTALHPNA